jgi:hypothetical protein
MGRETNKARFTGRIDRRTIAWKVSNTNPNVTGAAAFERHRKAIEKIFSKDVTHTYLETSPSAVAGGGRATPGTRGMPFTYMMPPAMSGMNTMQIGAQAAMGFTPFIATIPAAHFAVF